MKDMIITCLLLLQFMQLSAQRYKSNMPWIDLSENHAIQTVISQGTPLVYNGHPTTLLLEDQKTILCVWSSGHGGKASYMGISNNAGLSWNVQKTPADWQGMSNCPSIYQMTDKKGASVFLSFVEIRIWDTHTVRITENRGLRLKVFINLVLWHLPVLFV